jgi:hypothetical protein
MAIACFVERAPCLPSLVDLLADKLAGLRAR